MNKEQAIEKLKRQLNIIEELRGDSAESAKFQKWERDTRVAFENIFDKSSQQSLEFINIAYHRKPSWVEARRGVTHTNQYSVGLDEVAVLIKSCIDEINEYWDKETHGDIVREGVPSTIENIDHLCKRFHLVSRQLRSRYNGRQTLEIEDEYDVQDLLHALLTIYFDDIRPEEWTPSYAGGSSRMDFLLKQEKIVIETKKTRKGLGAKEVGEQLLVDIQKYKEHSDCKTLVCFVYDPEGRIGNPRGIENDLNKTYDGLPVKVLITPTGM